MSRQILKLELDETYTFIGIVASLPPHKMAICLNQLIDLDLIRGIDISIENAGNTESDSFPYFQWYDEISHVMWELIGNKGTQILLSEQKNMDYVLRIQDESEMLDIQKIITKLKTGTEIGFIAKLDPMTFKNKNRLFFNKGEITQL